MSDIEEWIKRQVESGYTVEEVKDAMAESGRDPSIVDSVLEDRERSSKSLYVIGITAVLLIFAVLFFVYGTFGVTVTREFESPQPPGKTPRVNLTVEGDYSELSIREEVPPGLGVISEDGVVDEENNVVEWDLDGERSEVSYLVVTPGASTGDYNFSGTYLYGGEERTIQGDSHLEVRW